MNACDETFAGCAGITSLTLPEGITTIGDSAFFGECKRVQYAGGEQQHEGVDEVKWVRE